VKVAYAIILIKLELGAFFQNNPVALFVPPCRRNLGHRDRGRAAGKADAQKMSSSLSLWSVINKQSTSPPSSKFLSLSFFSVSRSKLFFVSVGGNSLSAQRQRFRVLVGLPFSPDMSPCVSIKVILTSERHNELKEKIYL
jgi:hypothetical protein